MTTTLKVLFGLLAAVVVFAFGLFMALETQRRQGWTETQEAYQKASLQVCVQSGGVPILEYGKLQLLDCKFPNILPHAVEVK